MDYPRFFIPEEKIFNEKFSLENPQDVKKIRKVLRLGQKNKIILLDNTEYEYLAEIEKPTKEAVKGIILQKRPLVEKRESKLKVSLAQALPKASKMDDIVRMNTELGVKKFIPFESDFSVIKLDKFNPKKLARWRKIAKSASEQSERNQIPEITEPLGFEALLDLSIDENFQTKILLHSRMIPGSKEIEEVKSKLLSVTPEQNSVLVGIGPEGGFSEQEIAQARENGWQTVWMDLPILRTETAGLLACGYLLI